MTLRDFLDDVLEDKFISLKLGEYGFASAFSFRKYRVNKLSKLLDCKVQSIGSNYVNNHSVITVHIECEDLNDIKNFLNRIDYV